VSVGEGVKEREGEGENGSDGEGAAGVAVEVGRVAGVTGEGVKVTCETAGGAMVMTRGAGGGAGARTQEAIKKASSASEAEGGRDRSKNRGSILESKNAVCARSRESQNLIGQFCCKWSAGSHEIPCADSKASGNLRFCHVVHLGWGCAPCRPDV